MIQLLQVRPAQQQLRVLWLWWLLLRWLLLRLLRLLLLLRWLLLRLLRLLLLLLLLLRLALPQQLCCSRNSRTGRG